ncbi:unnamed protein product [Cuscuta campestris]|uniref:CCHC-type domain-containing protein n=1 Tax=Cuscuta campestris TaxID=132261 RepID=A0A484LNL4_9ASTE|nr:unnamed protein product [Cuscuta campestris]
MLPGESFDMLDERFHKILNDLASLNHVLSPKEKNVRLLRSLPTEWYTKATAMEEGRNLENNTVQGLLDELRTYEHELKKKKEEQVTPFPTTLMTTPRVPSSEGTCPRSCDTPSSSQPSSSKMENYDEEFAMMVKQFRKFKKFFKKANSVRRPTKGKPQVSDSPPESYLCYNCRKPGHWKSACPYPKVEKYGERERNEKKKKAMVAAESDESSSSSSDEEALVCMERRVEKSNHEDRWTMSEDDTLCLMAKDDADQEVTSQTSCSSSYESIPTSENLFDQFKKMMVDFEEINLKHSSLTEENKLLSGENLKLTEGRKSQQNEITQLKTENESLSEKVKSLNKELGILKSKEAVDKLLETTKHKGREGLGFDPSSSKRKGRTTFIPPKPTAKPNKQKGKEKEKPTKVPKKDMASLKNISTNEVILTGKRIRNIYEVMWDNVKEACLISKGDTNLLWLWHKRLSHLNFKTLNKLSKEGLVEGLPKAAFRKESICDACQKGKQVKSTFKAKSAPSTTRILSLIHMDLFGPVTPISLSGKKYVLVVVDDYSRYTWTIFLNGKKETQGKLTNCMKLIQNQANKDEEVNERDRMKPTEFIPFRSLPLKTSQRNPDLDSAEPSGNFGQPSNIPDLSNDDNSGNGDPVPIYPETPTTSVLQPEAELDQPVDPNQHNLRWLRDHPPQQIIGDIQSCVRTRRAQQNLEAMLACFISQVEPKNIEEALADSDWINAMQEELNQFSRNDKKLGEKLRLPNSGTEVGKFPVQNLDWNIIGISGRIPSGAAKKADLNNDYKLVLELVIACLECGSGGAASKGKKYEARYWLYYLSSKGENIASASATAEESSSDNVPLINLAKTAKRKHVVSPSPSVEAPQNLALICLEEEEEISDNGELQRKKKRKINSPSTSGNVNPDELKEKEPAEETYVQNRNPQQSEEETPQDQSFPTSSQPQTDDADNQFWQLYYDWKAWKVGNSAEQLLNWDQQLKNEKIIKKCLGIPVNHNCEQILDDYWVWQRNPEELHLEYLADTPVSDCEADDEDTAVFKPVFSKAIEDQVALTSEAHTTLEVTAEGFQTFPETSPAFETETSPAFQETSHASEMVLTEVVQEKATSPPQEQNQETAAEEEEFQQLIQSQVLETLTTPCEISNPTETEILEKSAEIPEYSSTHTLPDEIPEIWTKKVQGLIESALASQHASFRQEIKQMEAKYTQLLEKSEEKHSADLKEIGKSVDKTLEIISLLSNTVSNTMEIYASDSQLQFKEFNKVKEQIASVTVGLQKQMSLLQMDIRSALAVASANQVVTKDYLKVIIDNQKEAYKLFRLIGAHSGNRKMEVILQQHIPSPIPQLPIAVKEGEASYIPSHLNMTNLILEAQQRNPENSA